METDDQSAGKKSYGNKRTIDDPELCLYPIFADTPPISGSELAGLAKSPARDRC